MKRWRLLWLVVIACATSLAHAQTSSQTPAAADTSAAAQTETSASENTIRGVFPVTLLKSVDSRKLKAGDTFTCKTTAALRSRSGLMIPSGALVTGHITEAQARSKGNPESTLAMVFDKIQIGKGKDIPFKGTLQAVAPSIGADKGPDTGAAGSGTLPNGRGADMSTMPPPTSDNVVGPNSGIHSTAQSKATPILNSSSVGVLGIKNLTMTKDSVLTSTGKQVKLEDGSQMMIRAEIEIPVH